MPLCFTLGFLFGELVGRVGQMTGYSGNNVGKLGYASYGSYDSLIPVLPQGVPPILLDPHSLPQQDVVPTLHDTLPLPVTPQGGVPNLRDLCLLPVADWYLLGLQLGVSADELDVIERNYPRDNRMCKAKMFAAWLRMDTSATYQKLARALVAVGKRNIAEAMCTARGTKATTLECPCIVYYSKCTCDWVEV